MKPSERRHRIIELLLQNGAVNLAQLVDLLQVSEGTVRNDLRALEKQGDVIRTHGGAVLNGTHTPRGRKSDEALEEGDAQSPQMRPGHRPARGCAG